MSVTVIFQCLSYIISSTLNQVHHHHQQQHIKPQTHLQHLRHTQPAHDLTLTYQPYPRPNHVGTAQRISLMQSSNSFSVLVSPSTILILIVNVMKTKVLGKIMGAFLLLCFSFQILGRDHVQYILSYSRTLLIFAKSTTYHCVIVVNYTDFSKYVNILYILMQIDGSVHVTLRLKTTLGNFCL